MSPNSLAEPLPDLPRVLLVEDDVLLRELLAEAMRDTGMTVVEVASADEAQRYIEGAGKIDLVFTDVEMPGSMDGVELAWWLRQNHPETKLIVTSGRSQASAAGVGKFIAKPYRIFEAVGIVRTMLST